MARIYLIGFMGSGKSEVGRLLANTLEVPFCDLDDRIADRSGFSIPEIFKKFGEAEFRKLEASALYSLKNIDDLVVATGGGTPCFYNNMDLIKSTGVSVYLQVTPKILADRLSLSGQTRPLLPAGTEADLYQYIVSTLGQREAFYKECDITVNGADTVTAIVREIQSVISNEPMVISD